MGRLVGLALIWMNDLNLDIKSFLANHIDAYVREAHGGNYLWRVIGFYGFSNTSYCDRS